MSKRLRFTRRRRWPRRLRRALAALVLLAIVAVGITLPTVVLPETKAVPGDTDAVVLLAGGHGERFATAERVLPRGDTDLLVVSNSTRDDWPGGRTRCDRSVDGYDIVCVEPVPLTLRGEARTIATLAGEEGWDQLTVLTSTYQVTRARMLFERCTGAEVAMVGARPDLDPLDWVRISVTELYALARDRLIQRGC